MIACDLNVEAIDHPASPTFVITIWKSASPV